MPHRSAIGMHDDGTAEAGGRVVVKPGRRPWKAVALMFLASTAFGTAGGFLLCTAASSWPHHRLSARPGGDAAASEHATRAGDRQGGSAGTVVRESYDEHYVEDLARALGDEVPTVGTVPRAASARR